MWRLFESTRRTAREKSGQRIDGSPIASTADFDIRCVAAAAEKELGAFLNAVRQVFGPGAVPRAADLWILALDNTEDINSNPPQAFREISIGAVTWLTQKNAGTRLHDPAAH